MLTDEKYGVISSLSEIGAVGHRIVHGGEKFAASTIITDEVIAAITECNDLAPLHNPANLIGIDSCKKLMPNVPMVAVLIPHFIRQCRQRHIYMVFRMSIMRNIRFANMGSTEPAIVCIQAYG